MLGKYIFHISGKDCTIQFSRNFRRWTKSKVTVVKSWGKFCGIEAAGVGSWTKDLHCWEKVVFLLLPFFFFKPTSLYQHFLIIFARFLPPQFLKAEFSTSIFLWADPDTAHRITPRVILSLSLVLLYLNPRFFFHGTQPGIRSSTNVPYSSIFMPAGSWAKRFKI